MRRLASALTLLFLILNIPSSVESQRLGTTALCPITFDRDLRHPSRIDNEAKACLDDVAVQAQRWSDARLLLVGHRQQSEPPLVAAKRTLAARLYLVGDKGVDVSRVVSMYAKAPNEREVTIYILQSSIVDPSGIESGATDVPKDLKAPSCDVWHEGQPNCR